MEDYVTIKEFSRIVGRSKQAVYQRMSKDLKDYVIIENGQKLINREASKLFLIRDTVNIQVNNQDSRQESEDLTSQIEELKEEIQDKKRQVETLTEQNGKLIDRVGELTVLLGQTMLKLEMAERVDSEPVQAKNEEDSINIPDDAKSGVTAPESTQITPPAGKQSRKLSWKERIFGWTSQ